VMTTTTHKQTEGTVKKDTQNGIVIKNSHGIGKRITAKRLYVKNS